VTRRYGFVGCFVSLAALATLLWEQSGRQVSDVTLYQLYGERMTHGLVPYRDFHVEYPPGALPVFALPALVSGSRTGFMVALAVLLGLIGALGAVLLERASPHLRDDPHRQRAARWLVALSPVALGALLFTRYDLLPAALTVATLLALLGGRPRLGGLLLGLAIAVKLYPVVLLPLVLVWTYRRHGGLSARWVAALAVGIPIAAYLPFAVVAPDGVAWSIGHQLSRPLQIESLGSSLLLAAHHVLGFELGWSSGHGSQNLTGTAATVMALASSLAQVAVLVVLWWRFARGPATPERLVRYSAAAVVAFVVLGKVLSPQYLIWPLFLVPLVAGARGRVAVGAYGLAAVLTVLWFPARYWSLVKTFDGYDTTLVLLRNLVLVALLVVLLRERDADRLDR
jgi:hypothetical protein